MGSVTSARKVRLVVVSGPTLTRTRYVLRDFYFLSTRGSHDGFNRCIRRVGTGPPLSDATRRERRNLLGLCGGVIVVVHAGLLPNRIEALGIDFSIRNQGALMEGVGIIIAYFLAAFFVYAIPDFAGWRLRYNRALRLAEDTSSAGQLIKSGAPGNASDLSIAARRTLRWSSFAAFACSVRVGFDFGVPILAAILTSWYVGYFVGGHGG